MHRIELDSVRVDSNSYEYRMINRAKCGDLEVVGDGPVIRALAALMLSEGITGQCEVYRGKTPVFAAQNVSDWANGKALVGEQPESLRKYRERKTNE